MFRYEFNIAISFTALAPDWQLWSQ